MQRITDAQALSDPLIAQLRNPKKHEGILARNWSKRQHKRLMGCLEVLLKDERQTEMIIQLNELRKNLRSKQSLACSQRILRSFARETNRNMLSPTHQFHLIEQQLKDSAAQITKKKYFLKEEDSNGSRTAHMQRRKEARKGMSATQGWNSGKEQTKELIEKDLDLLRQAMDQQDLQRMGDDLFRKTKGVTRDRFGKWANRIQEYTIHEATLQKALALIQQDPANIEIRRKNKDAYQKIKTDMVAIVINEQQVKGQLNDISNKQRRNRYTFLHGNRNRKQNQVTEKERHELTAQIQDALQTATASIGQAFVRRGRPDQAYQMRMALEKKDSLHSVYKDSFHT